MTILTANIDAATDDAYVTTVYQETVVVAANVILVSDESNGINSGFGGAQIVNYGTVTGADAGVYSFGSSSSIIENEAGGLIAGSSYGIYVQETGDTVLNDSSITSNSVGIYDANGSMYVDNEGYIFGTIDGIVTLSGDNIVNSGTVASSKTAVSISAVASSSVSVDNTGLIRGSLEAITAAGAGSVKIANRGTIDGSSTSPTSAATRSPTRDRSKETSNSVTGRTRSTALAGR